MDIADWTGFAGVGILLFAFLLGLLKKIETTSFLYVGLNFIGAALACTASIMIRYMPFVILEGAWTIVSLVMMISMAARRTRSGH